MIAAVADAQNRDSHLFRACGHELATTPDTFWEAAPENNALGTHEIGDCPYFGALGLEFCKAAYRIMRYMADVMAGEGVSEGGSPRE